jgi:hypothetical protein
MQGRPQVRTFEQAVAVVRAHGLPLWRIAGAVVDDLTQARVERTGEDYATAMRGVLAEHPTLKTYYVGGR